MLGLLPSTSSTSVQQTRFPKSLVHDGQSAHSWWVSGLENEPLQDRSGKSLHYEEHKAIDCLCRVAWGEKNTFHLSISVLCTKTNNLILNSKILISNFLLTFI